MGDCGAIDWYVEGYEFGREYGRRPGKLYLAEFSPEKRTIFMEGVRDSLDGKPEGEKSVDGQFIEILGVTVYDFLSYPLGISFTVPTELSAYQAAYKYQRPKSHTVVEYAPNVGRWLVQVRDYVCEPVVIHVEDGRAEVESNPSGLPIVIKDFDNDINGIE